MFFLFSTLCLFNNLNHWIHINFANQPEMSSAANVTHDKQKYFITLVQKSYKKSILPLIICVGHIWCFHFTHMCTHAQILVFTVERQRERKGGETLSDVNKEMKNTFDLEHL